MAGLNPTNQDDPHPQKNPSITYDPQILTGNIPVAGSVSTIFDLQGWSEFALFVNPGNGTIAGTILGTVATIYGGKSLQDTFVPVYGTTGTVSSTIQFGSTTGQIISQLNILKPLRFVEFVMGGTQSQAVGLTLLVK